MEFTFPIPRLNPKRSCADHGSTAQERNGEKQNVAPPVLPPNVVAPQQRNTHSSSLVKERRSAFDQKPPTSYKYIHSVGSSRPMLPKRMIRQSTPTWSGFLLLIATIITVPSLNSDFDSLLRVWVPREGRSRVGVLADSCAMVSNVSTTSLQSVTITNDTTFNLSTVFACEDGEFNVSWSGVVHVPSTIKIGRGTTVRIFGDGATDGFTTLASTNASRYDSSDVNLELELERLSGSLNLPQLTSAAVGVHGGVSFGPIFFVDAGELHLERVLVRGGNATNSTTNAIVVGGGIYAHDSNISVSDCIFEDNFAEFLGGGINANWSSLTVNDSVFRWNKAGFQSFAGDENVNGAGGGIACENSTLYVDGCLFSENYASKKGGGVQVGVGQVSIVNSLFFNNVAGSDNVESEEELGEGAAFSLTACSQSFDGLSACGVNDTTFIYNTAARKGGAIALGSGSATSYVEFHRCIIHNSSSGWPIEDDPQGEGGAFVVGGDTILTLEDCLVTNNYCGKKGGAVTLSSGTSWEDPGGMIIMRNSTFAGNFAHLDSAGAIYLGEFAAARFEGKNNNFTNNACKLYGGAVGATETTNVTVEGGWFEGNNAEESGGVFWTRGVLNITGGNFSGNDGSENGGVVFASEESSVTLRDGHFENNIATDGGVVFVDENAALVVSGGVYLGNEARNGGGVFWGGDEGDVKITGGTFTKNEADFGGFLYVEGDGTTSCTGASIEEHSAVDGGAIYAVEDAVLLWECDLVRNEAITGPAIYAREQANITLHGVSLVDNIIARGSVVFVVSSTFRTDQVLFSDSNKSPDLSAVQLDDDSTYVAVETTFYGFQGEAVVFSEGTLYLDDCDFSNSTASVLVYSDPSSIAVVRNVVLGDNNFAAVIQESSEASEIPTNSSFINVGLKCSESGWPCSSGSPCLEGELGVYCQCYEQYFTAEMMGKTRCLDGNPKDLLLSEKMSPNVTFYPSLLEGDILVSLENDVAISSSSTTSLTTMTTSHPTSGGVVWNMINKSISWTTYPSAGLLYPGNSVTVRVVSSPDVTLDGSTKVTFTAEVVGAPEDSSTTSSSGPTQRQDADDGVTSSTLIHSDDKGGTTVSQGMNVTFFHCMAGSIWTYLSDGEDLSCVLCTDIPEADTESLDCSEPGASTRTLPIQSGYWRASLDFTTIRECFNKDACVGGAAVENVEDYCASGYEGPYCGVCSSGYGRGSANICHKCTTEFKGVMYFIFAVATLITVVVIVFLGIYLVGGRLAVSKTVSTIMELSTSGLLLRSEVSGRDGIDSRTSLYAHSYASGKTRLAGTSKKNSSCVKSYRGSDENAAEGVHAGGRASDITGKNMGSASGSSSGPKSPMEFAELTEEKKSSSNYGSDVDVLWAPDPASTRGSNQGHAVTVVTSEGGGNSGGERSNGDALHERKGTTGNVVGDGNTQEHTEDTEKTAATVIGEVLARLPLSKLKIVIVVWQISSAFAEITEVPFPAVYDKFLSIIGIFSFDLGWIMSAACLNVDMDFFDELLIVTIGPVLLLVLLGTTFSLGARSRMSTLYDPWNASGFRNRGVMTFPALTPIDRMPDKDQSSTGGTGQNDGAPSTTTETDATPASTSDDPTVAKRDYRGGGQRYNMGSVSRPLELRTLEKEVDETRTGNRRQHDPSAVVAINCASSTIAPSSGNRAQPGKGKDVWGKSSPLRPASPEFFPERRFVWGIWRDGPGDNIQSEQNRLWWLFARHTTMTLIVLYLVYSQVSTVVFQTFKCKDLDEIGKSYLRADFRIECDTPRHKAFKIYAAIMICVYPLGIPAAFWYFLARQRSRLNPPTDKFLKDHRGAESVLLEKMNTRKEDPTVAPTSFLWSAYSPNRYYYEVCECLRRLLLTGLLVFLNPGTGAQVAYSCLFAFISLLGFELLQPHIDPLERMLYRTGCLVIFFTNFLALMIKANLADPDSSSAIVYSVGLIIVNIFFVLSIWCNAFATIRATFSRSHVQGIILGVDILGEDRMDTLATAMKTKAAREKREGEGEVKLEDVEAPPFWEREESVIEDPTQASTRNVARSSGKGSPSSLGSQAIDTDQDNTMIRKSPRKLHPLRRSRGSSWKWPVVPHKPTAATPNANKISERGPISRGSPYASMRPSATSSSWNTTRPSPIIGSKNRHTHS